MEPEFELEIDVGRQGVIDEELLVESLAAADTLPEKALADLRRAARGEPGDPDYAYILGNALAHRGSHAEAAAAFREPVRERIRVPALRSGPAIRSCDPAPESGSDRAIGARSLEARCPA